MISESYSNVSDCHKPIDQSNISSQSLDKALFSNSKAALSGINTPSICEEEFQETEQRLLTQDFCKSERFDKKQLQSISILSKEVELADLRILHSQNMFESELYANEVVLTENALNAVSQFNQSQTYLSHQTSQTQQADQCYNINHSTVQIDKDQFSIATNSVVFVPEFFKARKNSLQLIEVDGDTISESQPSRGPTALKFNEPGFLQDYLQIEKANFCNEENPIDMSDEEPIKSSEIQSKHEEVQTESNKDFYQNLESLIVDVPLIETIVDVPPENFQTNIVSDDVLQQHNELTKDEIQLQTDLEQNQYRQMIDGQIRLFDQYYKEVHESIDENEEEYSVAESISLIENAHRLQIQKSKEEKIIQKKQNIKSPYLEPASTQQQPQIVKRLSTVKTTSEGEGSFIGKHIVQPLYSPRAVENYFSDEELKQVQQKKKLSPFHQEYQTPTIEQSQGIQSNFFPRLTLKNKKISNDFTDIKINKLTANLQHIIRNKNLAPPIQPDFFKIQNSYIAKNECWQPYEILNESFLQKRMKEQTQASQNQYTGLDLEDSSEQIQQQNVHDQLIQILRTNNPQTQNTHKRKIKTCETPFIPLRARNQLHSSPPPFEATDLVKRVGKRDIHLKALVNVKPFSPPKTADTYTTTSLKNLARILTPRKQQSENKESIFKQMRYDRSLFMKQEAEHIKTFQKIAQSTKSSKYQNIILDELESSRYYTSEKKKPKASLKSVFYPTGYSSTNDTSDQRISNPFSFKPMHLGPAHLGFYPPATNLSELSQMPRYLC